ncbi:MAG: uroporphyrinogen decarboxylase family protein [Lachnospiraceae bacterium]
MTGKEKLKLAINHQEGPLLFDVGGMPTTGMHCITVEKMREFYGLEKKIITIQEPVQMLGYMDDDLKEAMGIQTTPLWNAGTMFGFRQTNKFKEWKTPWGQVVLVSDEFMTTTNEHGDTYIYACGDTSYPPTGHMPSSGYYFDNIIRVEEFDEDNYQVEDNFEEFGPISEEDLAWLALEQKRLQSTSDVVMGNLGSTAFGDIALVPGPQLRNPKGIRDVEEWYVSTSVRQDELHQIFDYELKHAIANLESMYKVLGNTVQVAYICGNDFGTQNGPFCSGDTFNSLYLPYYKAVNDWIHAHTEWKTFKHSCGSIYDLMPNLIEAGFDIINPVQWTAKDMERNRLKKEFGDRIVFWGGGINTQKTLPFGTPDEVYQEASDCCRVFGKNGGFVFNTIHNIQPGVPAENLDAMVRAVRDYNSQF